MCRILADCSYRLMLSTKIKLYNLLTLDCKCHFDGHSERTGLKRFQTTCTCPACLFSENSVHTVKNFERKLF